LWRQKDEAQNARFSGLTPPKNVEKKGQTHLIFFLNFARFLNLASCFRKGVFLCPGSKGPAALFHKAGFLDMLYFKEFY
jgi:hypothetical protein